jgi:glycosyltransferase involved in cell wall biosynthesis
MRGPRVSVVTAAYNRGNVLRFAIESLLAATFEDWELLVIGDACTDDSEEVVRSFGDSRLSFFNLPVNSGDQAAPNNEGVHHARGEFIAFLNQDDLWTRDHLATCLDAIGEDGFVSTLTLSIGRDGVVYLGGNSPRGTYYPLTFLPASTWFMCRAFFENVGPWRPAREIFLIPSQEWLFRAWKRGLRLRSVEKPTVLALPSGSRKDSYSNRAADEHARYAALLREDPELMSRLMQSAKTIAPGAIRTAAWRIALAFGFHPLSVSLAWHYGRRGGFVDSLRRTRGLPPLPRENAS